MNIIAGFNQILETQAISHGLTAVKFHNLLQGLYEQLEMFTDDGFYPSASNVDSG